VSAIPPIDVSHRQPSRFADLFVFLAITGLIVALQLAAGAYNAEFGEPDEAAHFMTGLMIRDYVASGLPSAPMAFATDYYLHYPKVAFGMWPPLFHSMVAAWLLVFPISRVSIMMFMALLTAVLAITLYRIAAKAWDVWVGLAVAFVFVAMPLTQQVTGEVAADSQVALLDLWAVLIWARYLDRGLATDAAAFGVLGALSMLTKGNGTALLAVPFLSTAFARRWDLMARRSFWIGPALLVAIGGPWQVYSWRLMQRTVALAGTPVERLLFYSRMIPSEVGLAVIAAAMIGSAALVWQRISDERVPSIWAAIAALPVAIILFHLFVPLAPVRHHRYLISVLPPILLIAAYGVRWVAKRLPWGVAREWGQLLVGSGVLVAFFLGRFTIPSKPHYGFDQVARELVNDSACVDCAILTSSTGDGDGMFITQVAMQERRPGHFVLRGDKVLSRSDWDGNRYELLQSDADSVNRFLLSVPVEFVVIDDTSPKRAVAHHDLLIKALRQNSQVWAQVQPANASTQKDILLYKNRAFLPNKKPRIHVDMHYSLGRVIGTAGAEDAGAK
jgi:dolichyl-phosphate-mannose-protein mannosyltransferase